MGFCWRCFGVVSIVYDTAHLPSPLHPPPHCNFTTAQDQFWLEGVAVGVLTSLGLLLNLVGVAHPPRPLHLPRLLAITGRQHSKLKA